MRTIATMMSLWISNLFVTHGRGIVCIWVTYQKANANTALRPILVDMEV